MAEIFYPEKLEYVKHPTKNYHSHYVYDGKKICKDGDFLVILRNRFLDVEDDWVFIEAKSQAWKRAKVE